MSWAGACALGILLLALTGCGIKSPPLAATSVAPQPSGEFKARTVAAGVEVTFAVPGSDQPGQQVVGANLYYGYLPVTGDPDCPPCPPRLREYRPLDLTQQLKPGEGGTFTYLDRDAPMDMMAVYQVQFVDARSRKGQLSGYARAVRALAPAPPMGLRVKQGDAQVALAWPPVTRLANGQPAGGQVGYIVYRQGPDGEHALNERPLSQPGLTDKSGTPGQQYQYRVAAVREVNGYAIEGQPGAWVGASPLDQTGPSAPGGLVGASFADGIYLRFTPSPERDTKGYFVERAAAKTGPYVRLHAQPLVDNTYVDKDVKMGAVYWYRVVAMDEAGNPSPPSPPVSVKQQP
ncbi:MAG: fibronectin type III domain-containing protein [Pseudomonadota bacterium]